MQRAVADRHRGAGRRAEAEAAFRARPGRSRPGSGVADEAAAPGVPPRERSGRRAGSTRAPRGSLAEASCTSLTQPAAGADTLRRLLRDPGLQPLPPGRVSTGALEAAEDGARPVRRTATRARSPRAYGDHPVVACHTWEARWRRGSWARRRLRSGAPSARSSSRASPRAAMALAFALARAAIVRQARLRTGGGAGARHRGRRGRHARGLQLRRGDVADPARLVTAPSARPRTA